MGLGKLVIKPNFCIGMDNDGGLSILKFEVNRYCSC